MRAVLLDQLTSPVRFGDAVAVALDSGADRFVELGHGRVLSGLVKRVRRDAAVSQVGEPDDVEALAA
jgi:[acyl-carrier-protein] S-malonyltransferase